jgi:phosphomannomutase/phosphoglucomutase
VCGPKSLLATTFRAYSSSVKNSLVSGLLAAGCKVHDIGLCMTPMAYFAQFDLDVPCVAMVTASHNDNGWTGVKMGANRPAHLRAGRDDAPAGHRARRPLRRPRRRRVRVPREFPERYIADLTKRPKLKRRLKVVCACGNGTAGAFRAARARGGGLRADPLDCELDHTFPHYNPTPKT